LIPTIWARRGVPQISTQELFLHREIDYFQAATLLPGRLCLIAMFCLSLEIFDSARVIEAMRVLRAPVVLSIEHPF
jgi:hypothetical protein